MCLQTKEAPIEEREERLIKERIRGLARREKLRQNPIAYEKYLERERRRNKRRKEIGKELKFKSVKCLTDEEKEIRREKQRQWSRNYRSRQAKNSKITDFTNLDSVVEQHPIPAYLTSTSSTHQKNYDAHPNLNNIHSDSESEYILGLD